MVNDRNGEIESSEEYQVLTIGTSWKSIECSIPHLHSSEGNSICINGLLYYPALRNWCRSFAFICFDVNSEKFSFIKDMKAITEALGYPSLINYNGKLGLLSSDRFHYVNGSSKNISLWVLEDAEEEEWSKHTYVLPDLWQSIVGNYSLSFVGVTHANEIVFAPLHQEVPFYLFYYNTEKETVARVGIQGMEAFRGRRVYTYLDHVEDVRFMQTF